MINVQNLKWGFLIENKLLFGANEIDNEYLNLSSLMWEDMRYKRTPHVLLDYPWEYDIQWVWIKVLLWNDGKLNYIINTNWKRIWLIQSQDIMEKDDVIVVTNRLYLDDKILEKIEQMELEWEKVKLMLSEPQIITD